jgi:hypothetical protein
VAASAQSLKTQHFESCWRLSARSTCAKSLKESEFTSSGGIVPFVNTVGTDPGEVRTGRSFEAEESLKEENQRSGLRRGKSAKSRRPSDLGEAARGLVLRRRKGTKGHRDSVFGVCGGKSFAFVEIANRFLDLIAISRSLNRSRRFRDP